MPKLMWFKADPEIFLSKKLTADQWRTYCLLEEFAGRSRRVYQGIGKIQHRLGFYQDKIYVLLSFFTGTPSGSPLIEKIDPAAIHLRPQPARFVKGWSWIINVKIPDWKKRVFFAIYAQEPRHGRYALNISRLLRVCSVPARAGADQRDLVWAAIATFEKLGILRGIDRRPGAAATTRISETRIERIAKALDDAPGQEAEPMVRTYGADPSHQGSEEEVRTIGSDPSHHRSAEVRTIGSDPSHHTRRGQNPESPPERVLKTPPVPGGGGSATESRGAAGLLDAVATRLKFEKSLSSREFLEKEIQTLVSELPPNPHNLEQVFVAAIETEFDGMDALSWSKILSRSQATNRDQTYRERLLCAVLLQIQMLDAKNQRKDDQEGKIDWNAKFDEVLQTHQSYDVHYLRICQESFGARDISSRVPQEQLAYLAVEMNLATPETVGTPTKGWRVHFSGLRANQELRWAFCLAMAEAWRLHREWEAENYRQITGDYAAVFRPQPQDHSDE